MQSATQIMKKFRRNIVLHVTEGSRFQYQYRTNKIVINCTADNAETGVRYVVFRLCGTQKTYLISAAVMVWFIRNGELEFE